MKKVGIITLNGYFNYGNRLQNYALQETIRSLDFEVETIWVKKSTRSKTNLSALTLKTTIEKIKKRFLRDRYLARRKMFKEFSEKYIVETDYQISENNIPMEKISEYDYFVVGSDQV